MADSVKSKPRSWWSLLLRSVFASTFTAALLDNIRVDWMAENNLGKTAFSIHVVIYVLRTVPWLIFARICRIPERSSFLSLLDAIAVRLLNFSSRAPSVVATRPLLNIAAILSTAVCVRRNPRTHLKYMHFGLSTAPHEAICITLDCERSLSDCVVLMAFHGGGYTTGQCEMYMPMYTRLLRVLDKLGIVAAILSVEYPLAPEYPYPAAVDFAHNVFNELVVTRCLVDPRKIILLGDSAGGGLCFALSLRLADDAAADGADSLQVAGLITICPWVTHEFETASFTNMHGQDYLHSGVVRRASKMYIGDDNHHMHPEISVSTHPSVHLLPPTLMFYGDRELFADSIVSFADSLEEQSCEVELVKGKGMPHVYASLWPLFQPESGRAIDKMADFVLKNVSTQ